MSRLEKESIVKFKGYAQTPEEGELLFPGDLAKIVDHADQDGYIVLRCDETGRPLDENGNPVVDPNAVKELQAETVFLEEIEVFTPPAADAVRAPAPHASAPVIEAPALAKSGKKGAAAKKAAEPALAPVAAAATATVKAKPVTKKQQKAQATVEKEAAAAASQIATPAPVASSNVIVADRMAKARAVRAAKKEEKAAAKKAALEGKGVPDFEQPSKPLVAVAAFNALDSELVRMAIDSVATGDIAETQSALLAAKQLVSRVEEAYYTLGGILAFIKQEGAYKSLGYDGKRGFAEYCSEELGVDYRKAQDLVNIFESVQRAGVDESRLAEIGWSKAIQIARVGKDIGYEKLREDWDLLVDYATEHNRDELIEHIKTSYENIRTRNDERVKKITFHFSLVAEQAEACNAALEAAKSFVQGDDPNQLFAHILTDWRMMTENVPVDRDTEIRRLEERLGVRLQIVDEAPARSRAIAG